MPKYVFTGKPVALGRFGDVRTNDVLNLTPHEEIHIEGDKRFEAFDEKKHGKKPERRKIELPKDFDKKKPAEQADILKGLGLPETFLKLNKESQEEAVAKAQQAADAESDRANQVSQRNSETQLEEIRQMTIEKLRDLVKKLRSEGSKIEIKEDQAEAKALRRAIINALFGDNAPKDEE